MKELGFIGSILILGCTISASQSQTLFYGNSSKSIKFVRNESDVHGCVEKFGDFEGSWFESVPMPPVAVARSKSLEEGSCKRQLDRYMADLKRGKMWAAQMFDASVKYPFGIIDGFTKHLGSFDQCYRLDVEIPNENDISERVQGRYCIVDFKFYELNPQCASRGKLDFDFDPNESVWESLKEKGDFRRGKRYQIQMGLCVPASCSANDVIQALKGPYEKYASNRNGYVQISIDKYNCQAYHEEEPISSAALVYCFVLLALVGLVIVASLYDSTLGEDQGKDLGRPLEYLLCFSIQRNVREVFSVNYNHQGLDVIHIIRFLMMCLVIIGHRMMQYSTNPIVNKRYLELSFDALPSILLHNGSIVVNGFFGIGGLLTSYNLLKDFNKTKKMNFRSLAFMRYMRFTPAYALVIFFNIFLYPHLGSGPQWRALVNSESENCAKTWWSNLLYVNNYVTMDSMCMFQSWYLAVDFHCYILSIVLIYAFWKLPRKLGYSFLALVTSLTFVIPFYLTYSKGVMPFFIGFPVIIDLSTSDYFKTYYVATHVRMHAYLVGIIAGAVLYDYKDAKWQFSKHVSYVLLHLAVMMYVTSQFLGFKYLNPNTVAPIKEVGFYASLHRGFYALSICSLVLLCTMGNGLDKCRKLLTPSWVQPLAKLTYSVYVSHFLLFQYQAAVMRSARTFTINTGVHDLAADVFFTFSLALVLSTMVEIPFRKIGKILMTKKTEKLC